MAGLVDFFMSHGQPPTNSEEVMGFVVRHRQNGNVVHHELMPSGDLSSARLAHRASRRVEELERRFRYQDGYEVESGIYNSSDTYFHANPDVPQEDA